MTVHQSGGRLLFEIPERLLGRDMIAVQRVADVRPRSRSDLFRGKLAGTRAFRWARDGDGIALRWRAPDGGYAAGRHFPVVRLGADSVPVIDVTEAYVRTVSVQTLADAERAEAGPLRSRLRFVHAFRDRVELEVEHVFADRTVTMHWSLLVRKPPILPRLADRRVSYFTMPSPEGTGEYIRRYRLEKKDPAAAVSDAVQPIVFYIDPEMPNRWVSWIKRGIEAWRPAFEAAGFRNAIVAREAPSPAEDPAWSLLDASHSAVTWVDEDEENAAGWGTAFDEETGEILSGQVMFYGGMESLMQRVGFALLGGVPDIPLPFPDSVLGEFMAMVTTHEVGHALGFTHNFKAGSAYPTDSLHDAAFVRRWGYSASLMDYAYFNFTAQPEDKIPFSDRHGRIGPYDVFALGWGYRPIPGAPTPEAELPTLESWRRAQDTAAYLRGSLQEAAGIDPGDQPDDIGADLVKSAEDAVRNFARVGTRLTTMRRTLRESTASPAVPPVEDKQRWTPAFDIDMVESYQDETLGRWALVMTQAAGTVGGAVPKAPYTSAPESQQFTPFDSASQVNALRFVLNHTFRGQDDFVQTQFVSAKAPLRNAASLVLLDSLPNGWELGQWREKQAMVLRTLVDGGRLERIAEQGIGVLPVFCAELDALRRELAPAIERGKQAGIDVSSMLQMQQQIQEVVSEGNGVCQQNGWKPTP